MQLRQEAARGDECPRGECRKEEPKDGALGPQSLQKEGPPGEAEQMVAGVQDKPEGIQ